MSTIATASRLLAVEVWIPDHHAGSWRLAESSYGANETLRPDAARARADGLLGPDIGPGAALVTELDEERAARSADAPAIDAALILPAYDGDCQVARTILLLSGEAPAAVELWNGQAGEHELSIADAWHPGLERFSTISRHVRFPIGSGLPGRAWERGTAQLCADLHEAPTFLRSTTAASEGLHQGLALPVVERGVLHEVAVLLNGDDAPLFRVAEVWLPASDSATLRRGDATYPEQSALGAAAARLSPRPGVGLIGRAWSTRRPVLADGICDGQLARGDLAAGEGITGALAIPTLIGKDITSVCLVLW